MTINIISFFLFFVGNFFLIHIIYLCKYNTHIFFNICLFSIYPSNIQFWRLVWLNWINLHPKNSDVICFCSEYRICSAYRIYSLRLFVVEVFFFFLFFLWHYTLIQCNELTAELIRCNDFRSHREILIRRSQIACLHIGLALCRSI